MAIRFANNAQTTLASAVLASDTTLSVNDASAFPALAAGDHCYITLESLSGDLEIVKATAISGSSITVVRGQDGTSARGFSQDDFVQLRLTAAGLNELSTDEEANATAVALAIALG